MNRREFLIQTGSVTAGCLAGGLFGSRLSANEATAGGPPRAVAIVSDPADPVAAAKAAQWASGQLRDALTRQGIEVRQVQKVGEARPADLCLIIAGAASPHCREAGVNVPAAAESLVVAPARLGTRAVLFVGGRDARGLVYALLDLADAVNSAPGPWPALQPAAAVTGQPANQVRSVMRLFVSDVEDQAWFNDRDFWRRYLSRLATERFNRFNLALGLGYDSPTGLRDTYFYFAYPFLLAVPGFDVRARNLPDAERDRNLEMLRFISDEAAARGLDFQLGLWTHAYRWIDSPAANYTIEGLTPQTEGPYCREALALILKACPNITGVTFRIHGESGVPEGSYGLWRTIFDGCRRSGRRVTIDLHAKGIDQPTI